MRPPNKCDLTIEQIKNILDYNPETGIFTRKIVGSEEKGYLKISINGKKYLAHRLAWLMVHGSWPKDQIDHIDRNGMNNKISNLREATPQQNAGNKGLQKNNKSGHRGVHWNTRERKWEARIIVNGKQISLGAYKNKEDAIKKRKEVEIEIFGEFLYDQPKAEQVSVTPLAARSGNPVDNGSALAAIPPAEAAGLANLMGLGAGGGGSAAGNSGNQPPV